MEIDELICKAVQAAKARSKSRENSVVITKLQEALFWRREDQRLMAEIAKARGVGPAVYSNGEKLANVPD